MTRFQRGFSLVELLVVVLVIGIILAFAIPNYLASESRALEASVKANMHMFQLAAEDFRVTHDSTYAGDAADVAQLIKTSFANPFDKSTGAGGAWEDRGAFWAPPTARPGIVSYCDSAFGLTYNIKGQGRSAPLELVLTNGR